MRGAEHFTRPKVVRCPKRQAHRQLHLFISWVPLILLAATYKDLERVMARCHNGVKIGFFTSATMRGRCGEDVVTISNQEAGRVKQHYVFRTCPTTYSNGKKVLIELR